MGDIVQGPWGSRPPDPTNEDDNDVMENVQSKLELLMTVLYVNMSELEDVDKISHEYYNKDMILIAESIRSMLLKLESRYHPCQDVCDNMYYWDPATNNYQTQNSLIVEFK